MAGRGATTFQKRQKEQNRKEKRQEKLARRLQRKTEVTVEEPLVLLTGPRNFDDDEIDPLPGKADDERGGSAGPSA